jgi:RIO kinase 1
VKHNTTHTVVNNGQQKESQAKEQPAVAIYKGQALNRDKQKQELLQLAEKYSSKINLGEYPGKRNITLGGGGGGGNDSHNVKDKSDRATVEQVLDPRTRMILFKMLNKGMISQVNGCLSTGKEANVYHAQGPATDNDTMIHYAIKIYKTSILVFKDRDRYVSGEFRFRHGYSKSNPRKMVQTWAEKEMRNLKRLMVAGIPCPEPVLLRLHVLVMTFIGNKNGWYLSIVLTLSK